MIFAKPRHSANAGPACQQRVVGSPAASAAIIHLRTLSGHLTLHHTGGAVGTVETHRAHSPRHAGRHEACIGLVGGAPFYVDYDEDKELGYPDFEVDVAEGAGEVGEPRLISRAIPREPERP